MPTIAICPKDSVYRKTFSNIEEIKARSGKIISIATEGDEKIKHVSDDVIYVPQVEELLYPLVITIPLQLFAYHIADLKECDVDKPRNLAKSVTVE
jgi:glutamine---fructose-6-phosphate transaminase (isomerizing)